MTQQGPGAAEVLRKICRRRKGRQRRSQRPWSLTHLRHLLLFLLNPQLWISFPSGGKEA